MWHRTTTFNQHVGLNSRHVVSFWTPWPTRHLVVSPTWPKHVGDMSPTQHRMLLFGQQNRHADIRHNGLSLQHWDCEPKHIISGQGCVHMAASHSSSCWNSLYMYEANLLWVWSGYGAAIITYICCKKKQRESPITTTETVSQAYYIRPGMRPYGCQSQLKVLKHFI